MRVYVIARGTGWFVNGEARHRFAPDDVLFVPAGIVHRFEEFSNDFAVWVFFYGPEGGEASRNLSAPRALAPARFSGSTGA